MTAAVWLLLFLGVLLLWLLHPSDAMLSILCLMAAAPIVSWLLLLPLRNKQTVSLQAPSVTGKNAAVPLSLTLPGQKLPLGGALVWVEIQNSTTGEILRRRFRVSSRIQWELASPYCGCLMCRIVRVWALDLFGLTFLPLPCRDRRRITVMPDTFPIEVQQSLSLSQNEDCQDYAPDRRGQDLTETFQIRDYVPGDNLHQIHWKLSGKTGQLLVREASCPVDHSLLVFVERRWDAVSPRYADALMEAVVSLCQALVEAGIPYHLAWNQAQIRQYAIASPEQLPEAITALLKSGAVTEGLSGAAMYQRSQIPSGRILYFCNQLPPQKELFPAHAQIFLCADAPASRSVVVFDPDNMAEVLRHLEGGAAF